MSVTDGDREKATLVVARLPISLGNYRERDLDAARDVIATALAEEREKARAQVAWDLRDLINDSGGQVWTRALLDFAEGLEAK